MLEVYLNKFIMKKAFFFYMALMGFSQVQSQKSILQHSFDEARRTGFSGVVLVAKQGKIIFHKATGMRDFESQERLDKNDVFELASVSKQFTAMIIMMLMEQGKLQYDDPIAKYVQVPYPNITIRHLLTHTSGLPDYHELMDRYWDKSKVAGNPDILDLLNRFAPPALFAPGEKYMYSNTGYVLLGSIAEKASGQDFITLCRNWIFKPLKMTKTDIRSLAEKAQRKDFAVGHLQDSTQKYVNANRFRSSDYTIWLGNRKGPGRISSTTTDLLKWDQALYSTKLVRQGTLLEAFTPARLNDGSETAYGFGWEIRQDASGNKIVQHTGDNPGYRTILVRFLNERKTVIILNNNAHEAMRLLVQTAEKS